MGGIFKAIGKIAKIAIPTVIGFYTGGPAGAAAGFAQGLSSATAKTPKQSAVTGQVQSPAEAIATTTSPTESAEEVEKKKRLALNAAGSSGTTTSPLGVTTSANVTKRNLLGL